MIGQTLGHYRVVSKIAAGGMGVVYRAHDERLDRDVALKVLPAGTIANEEARKRFRQEALALAKLNHPNIETVHEFGSQEGMDYLAMELIAGHPLSEKLREGPLPEHELLRLAAQFVDGLAAAHEHNIVHRDIKPGNLMVMPDGRLKILDFGLAKLVQPEIATDLTQSSSTETGQLAGTIPYMSPEQLRGLPADQRSDIFAAGAVLYEMATGHRPFPQAQSIEIMGAILHKTPEPPSHLNIEVSPGLESVIAKTLEKDPESRYHTARELKAALEGISATSHRMPPSALRRAPAMETPPPPQRQTNSPVLWAVGVALIVAAGLLIGLNVRGVRDKILGRASSQSSSEGNATPVKARRSVAVLGFKNVSSQHDKDWESTAMAEMFTTELGAGGQLRTVSGEDVAQMKTSLALPDTDTYGQETLQKIHKNLNADLVVLGSYIPLPDGEIRIDVRLQDTAQGVTLASVSKKGSDLDALVREAGADLREKIGVRTTSLTEAAEVKAAMPSTPDARRFYSEGLAKLRAADNIGARDFLLKAVLAEPDSAIVHSALAQAYTALGYDEKARQSARNAFDLSSHLSREDRLLVEARYREANKEWDHAIESYRTLFGFFSDNPEYGLLLANAQISGGKAKDSLDTIESLQRLPPPARDDPRIDLAEANASFSLGDFRQSVSLAVRAATKARANDANLILARALVMQARALENLHQPQDASGAASYSRTIYHAAGDLRGEAATLEVEANLLADQGDLPGALRKYNEQLAITREIGNRHAEASAMNNMALVFTQQGDVNGARKMWEQALVGFHDVSDKSNSAQVLVNLAGISLEAGNLVDAKKSYGQALEIFQEVNDQSSAANAMAAIGTVLYAQGDCVGARNMLEQAISIDITTGRQNPAVDKLISLADVLQLQGDLKNAEKKYQDAEVDASASGDKSDAAYALFGLGKIAMYSADFQSARNYFNEALAIRTGLGEQRTMAQTQVALAQLAMEEGNFPDSVSRASAARDAFRKLQYRDDEVVASAVLIRASLAEGKTDEAERESTSAMALVRKSQSLSSRLDFAIASARLNGATGKSAAANIQLKACIAEAAKAGLAGYGLECRLALEQINWKMGTGTESRARLDQLQKGASEQGFLLIAKKAAETKTS